jgi:hypothetical protein
MVVEQPHRKRFQKEAHDAISGNRQRRFVTCPLGFYKIYTERAPYSWHV